ncbi:MAG: hypothetical protein RMI88_01745 [Nitrososphaerota archaeon]|nr:hypothetical protein [Nitrososphaerota archaeon]
MNVRNKNIIIMKIVNSSIGLNPLPPSIIGMGPIITIPPPLTSTLLPILERRINTKPIKIISSPSTRSNEFIVYILLPQYLDVFTRRHAEIENQTSK